MWELIREDIRRSWRAAAFMLAVAALFVWLFDGACISQLLFGLPCPACGMTRAALLFLTGSWKESFQLQPFFFALAAGVLLFAVCRYVLRKYEKLALYYGLVMLAAAFLFYGYRMAVYFPHTPPMTYRENNLLALMYKLIVIKPKI